MTLVSTRHPLRSVLAGLLALVLVVLGLAQVSPALHAELHTGCVHGCESHPEPVSDDDHSCAVTLFAATEIAPSTIHPPVALFQAPSHGLPTDNPAVAETVTLAWPRAPPLP